MNDSYYNIKGMSELLDARKKLRQDINRTKSDFSCHKSALVNSIRPSRILSSALDGVVSVVSDVTLLHKGYNLALSILDKILPDKDGAAPAVVSPVIPEKENKNDTIRSDA